MRTALPIAVALSLLVPAGVACAADATKAPAVVPPPAAGQSQIVFFRPSAMGIAISCNVREAGKMLGTTNNGRYFVLTVAPGPHKFTTRGEVTDELNIEAEPDETSYVKCKIGMGVMSGRPNLSPSTKEEFDAKSADLKPSDPEKMAKAIAADAAKQTAAN